MTGMNWNSLALVLGLVAVLLVMTGVRAIRRYAMQPALSTYSTAGKYTVPNGGGLIILAVVVLIFMPVGFALSDPTPVVRFALAGTLMGMIGFFDDLRALSRPLRLIAQILAAMIFIPAVPIQAIGLPRLDLELPGIFAYLVSIGWIVGLSNVYNYMDNIDGLAGSQAILTSLFWALIALISGNSLVLLLAVLLAGASAGFLMLNSQPTTIFLGEIGGTFLGFSIAAMPMLMQNESPRLIVTGALFVSLIVFDAALTFARYLPALQIRSRPTRSHLYERLIGLGDPRPYVLRLYLLISACFSVAGVLYWREPAWVALLVVVFGCVTLFIWVRQREHTVAPADDYDLAEPWSDDVQPNRARNPVFSGVESETD